MLREPTNTIWQALSGKPELHGFVLVGGSALALHLNHRISEDLDFAWPARLLPRVRLEKLTRSDPALRFDFAQDPWAEREADDASLELDDFSQTFILNDVVRVTFFCADEYAKRILGKSSSNRLHLATISEIFALESLLMAKRSKARDWFDLFVLMKFQGFTWKNFYEAFIQAGAENQYDHAANRLCSAQPTREDEGYESLLPSPPDVAEMREFFSRLRDAYERGIEA